MIVWATREMTHSRRYFCCNRHAKPTQCVCKHKRVILLKHYTRSTHVYSFKRVVINDLKQLSHKRERNFYSDIFFVQKHECPFSEYLKPPLLLTFCKIFIVVGWNIIDNLQMTVLTCTNLILSLSLMTQNCN